MTDTIHARPAHYDLEHEGDDADVLFYLEFVRRLRSRRVTELRCGSRRLAVPLAPAAPNLDLQFVGIDRSDQMRHPLTPPLARRVARDLQANDNFSVGVRFVADVAMPNVFVHAHSMQHPSRSLVTTEIDSNGVDSARMPGVSP